MVEAGLEPIERVQVSGNLVVTAFNNVPVQSVASCPNTHPILIGGSYDIDSSSVDLNFMSITTDFDILSNSFIVTAEQFSAEINFGVRAHALCATVNFPTMNMIGGLLLDIDTTSLLVASIGTNPVIAGLFAVTVAGVVGQAVWFVYRKKKSDNS